MEKLKLKSIRLVGIALPHKTSNQNEQSSVSVDCGKLWQKFEQEGIFDRISRKKGNEVYAVYHNYEGDYMAPFSYFIGCRVDESAGIPDGLSELIIPAGNYQKYLAKGKMPDCIAKAWREIWKSDFKRIYNSDFEVYDDRSHDWNNAEVDIFLSVE